MTYYLPRDPRYKSDLGPTDEQFEGIIGIFPKWQQRELRRQRYGWDYELVPTRDLVGFWLAVTLIVIAEVAAVVAVMRGLLR